MTRTHLIFLFAFVFNLLNAQELLIPFKKSNHFGLVNQDGKTVVEPTYNSLNWLTGKYFASVIEKDGVEMRGLFYRDKEIIKPQPAYFYRVMPEMMIMGALKESKEHNTKSAFVLYDSNGNKIESAEFRKLEMIATAGQSSLNPGKQRYALLYSENFDRTTGIFIYDADEKKIKEWFFESVTAFKTLDKSKIGDIYYISYTDAQNKTQRKIITITKEYFEFDDLVGEIPEKQVVGTSEQPIVKSETVKSNKAKKTLYKEENGELIMKIGEESQKINLPKGVVPIFKHNKIKNQAGNLIFIENEKYGWINDGKLTPAVYDSLVYFGNDYYLGCQKNGGKMSCGTFDLNFNPVIPMEYDSVLGIMKRFEFLPQRGTANHSLEINEKSKSGGSDELSYSVPAFANVVAYKNGKASLLKLNGSKILMNDYDEIGQNGLNIPAEVSTDFIILKKDGLYGLIFSVPDVESGANIQQITEPVFELFPAFLIKDYYEQKGQLLIGLFNENGHFEAYATDFGVVYSD